MKQFENGKGQTFSILNATIRRSPKLVEEDNRSVIKVCLDLEESRLLKKSTEEMEFDFFNIDSMKEFIALMKEICNTDCLGGMSGSMVCLIINQSERIIAFGNPLREEFYEYEGGSKTEGLDMLTGKSINEIVEDYSGKL